MNLGDYGYNRFFADALAELGEPGLAPARVVAEYRHIYRLAAECGELLAEVSGRVRYEAAGRDDFPAVGDWVAVEPRPDEGRATIHAILPRRSRFSRKAAGRRTEEQIVAANVDTVFLLTGLDNDFSLRRIERYLALAWESGALPVVVLNKTDVCDCVDERAAEAAGAAPGVDVHAVSALNGTGLEAFEKYLAPGRTVALLGSSGVGKSTLINRLLGGDVLPTQPVRESDQRGRHTTTHRQLLLLAGGAMVMDTPGMRELQLWDAPEGVRDTFGDIESAAASCRFRDCTHTSEPGCAVLAAVAQGLLPPERLASFHKLRRELDYLERKQDTLAQVALKKKWKSIHKLARDHHPRE